MKENLSLFSMHTSSSVFAGVNTGLFKTDKTPDLDPDLDPNKDPDKKPDTIAYTTYTNKTP